MKLVNPSDAELNAAFAEKVAGWMRSTRLGKEVLYDPSGGHVLLTDTERHLPDFCSDANAVLVWLEKWRDRPYLYRLAQIDMTTDGWWVKLAQPGHIVLGEDFWHGRDESFTRAAVVALLRAHGVEVEIS